ncbi:MAG: hypothetical protein WDN06_17520 [Asticcacaulis sp.]
MGGKIGLGTTAMVVVLALAMAALPAWAQTPPGDADIAAVSGDDGPMQPFADEVKSGKLSLDDYQKLVDIRNQGQQAINDKLERDVARSNLQGLVDATVNGAGQVADATRTQSGTAVADQTIAMQRGQINNFAIPMQNMAADLEDDAFDLYTAIYRARAQMPNADTAGINKVLNQLDSAKRSLDSDNYSRGVGLEKADDALANMPPALKAQMAGGIDNAFRNGGITIAADGGISINQTKLNAAMTAAGLKPNKAAPPGSQPNIASNGSSRGSDGSVYSGLTGQTTYAVHNQATGDTMPASANTSGNGDPGLSTSRPSSGNPTGNGTGQTGGPSTSNGTPASSGTRTSNGGGDPALSASRSSSNGAGQGAATPNGQAGGSYAASGTGKTTSALPASGYSGQPGAAPQTQTSYEEPTVSVHTDYSTGITTTTLSGFGYREDGTTPNGTYTTYDPADVDPSVGGPRGYNTTSQSSAPAGYDSRSQYSSDTDNGGASPQAGGGGSSDDGVNSLADSGKGPTVLPPGQSVVSAAKAGTIRPDSADAGGASTPYGISLDPIYKYYAIHIGDGGSNVALVPTTQVETPSSVLTAPSNQVPGAVHPGQYTVAAGHYAGFADRRPFDAGRYACHPGRHAVEPDGPGHPARAVRLVRGMTMTHRAKTLLAGTALALVLALAGAAHAQSGASLVDPGTIGGYTGQVKVMAFTDGLLDATEVQTDYSKGYGVTADGSMLFGTAGTSSGAAHAFTWTAGGGFVDLGSLNGPDYASVALAASNDGSVVVGLSALPAGGWYGFRWTAATGMVVVDDAVQGVPGAPAVWGISGDGSVMVGGGYTPGTNDRAMVWTAATKWVNIGTLDGGNGGFSDAVGVSNDGKVAVGGSTWSGNGGAPTAISWTAAGGLVNLGTIGHVQGASGAIAADGDGGVIVGKSATASSSSHAFRWTAAGGMADLGSLGGVSGTSAAYGVSRDGSVVVGASSATATTTTHAFVWTAPTGMQDLNTLLSTAGVDMTGVDLQVARGVSADGNVIAGAGNFPNDPAATHAFLARIGGGGTGVTTPDSVVQSIQNLAASHQAQMVTQLLFTQTYLGLNEELSCSDCGGVQASFGSFNVSAHGRRSLSPDWTLLGGFGYGQYREKGARVTSSLSGAAALRYSPKAMGHERPFVEIGGAVSPSQTVDYRRDYANGAGTATGTGRTRSSLTSAYVRAGWIAMLSRADELGVSLSLSHTRQSQDGYAEAVGADNPFDATYARGSDRMNATSASVQYTHLFGSRWQVTADVTASRAYGSRSGVAATVAGAGTIGATAKNISWTQPGLSVSYRASNRISFDAFVNATLGPKAIGTGVHGGLGLNVKF